MACSGVRATTSGFIMSATHWEKLKGLASSVVVTVVVGAATATVARTAMVASFMATILTEKEKLMSVGEDGEGISSTLVW